MHQLIDKKNKIIIYLILLFILSTTSGKYAENHNSISTTINKINIEGLSSIENAMILGELSNLFYKNILLIKKNDLNKVIRKYNIIEERFGLKIRNGDRFDRFFRESEYKYWLIMNGFDILLWDDFKINSNNSSKFKSIKNYLAINGFKKTFTKAIYSLFQKKIKKIQTKTLNSIVENSRFKNKKINLLCIDV